ncbi:MAG: NosD domain-containing protein, partial [Halobacteria archaeon]|nr:NosD domain-containing protein [Halobacteria archaeon]
MPDFNLDISTRVGRAMLLLAVVVLAASIGSSVATPAPEGDRGENFDFSVPNEYSFSLPSDEGVAKVGGNTYDSVQKAVEAAQPGDTVVLSGVFNERVVINTSNITVTSQEGELAVVNGTGEGDVVTVNGEDVTLRRVWVRNSGYDTSDNDAVVWVNGSNTRIVNSRITEATFGVWINGVDGARIINNTIVGRERITPLSYRGNGIQVWKTENSVIKNNRITDVRDGIYYSWASNVVAENNVMWDLRYGVHYMYSDSCRLVNNTAFNNDVGYALMVSQELNITGNIAVNNTGGSGHGILVK